MTARFSEVDQTNRARISGRHGALPLSFITNDGQMDPAVRFQLKGAGHTIFFTPDEVIFRVTGRGEEGTVSASSVVRLRFAGANPSPRVEGLERLPGRANFFLGNDPDEWRTDVPTFGGVAYRELYPGVDLLYSGTNGRLKSEFRVAPGASPEMIRMSYRHVESMSLRGDGALVLETARGALIEEAPVVYQEIDGKRVEVEGRYRLLGEGRIGFALGRYDPAFPLVIDPTLIFSTYLGGSSSEWEAGYDIAVDSAGNAYVTGPTPSDDFPTVGAVQSAYGGGDSDAFVAKLDAAGSTLVYSTYLGGSALDCGWSIAVDTAGSAYLTGFTASSDFPRALALQQAYGGGDWDAFLTKLNPAGSALIYSTYLGGSGEDGGADIAVDAAGNAYVTGITGSLDFPMALPLQPAHGGGSGDVFVTKISPFGSSLVYSTYLGGRDADAGRGIAVDTAGSAYVTGLATFDFPLVLPLQPTYGGDIDAFVAKLNPAGSALVFSTYLGGSDLDWGHSIAVDGAGNAYVTGMTDSPDFPMADPLQPAHGGGRRDAFMTKLNPAGSALFYSTYLGGSGNDRGHGIAVDSAGIAYLTGETGSSDFPTTACPLQPGFGGGGSDAFVTTLDAAGSALVYSSYLGGSDHDSGVGIAVDAAGHAYVTGVTYSPEDFPTALPLQPVLNGLADVFVAKVDDFLLPIPEAGGVITVTKDPAGNPTCNLTWTAIPDAAVYNLYRGSQPGLSNAYNHTCFESSSPDTASTDTEGPAPGSLLFYYLVSGENACWDEGSLGTDSAGMDRPNSAPCP